MIMAIIITNYFHSFIYNYDQITHKPIFTHLQKNDFWNQIKLFQVWSSETLLQRRGVSGIIGVIQVAVEKNLHHGFHELYYLSVIVFLYGVVVVESTLKLVLLQAVDLNSAEEKVDFSFQREGRKMNCIWFQQSL